MTDGASRLPTRGGILAASTRGTKTCACARWRSPWDSRSPSARRGRRAPRGDEFDIMTNELVIVQLRDGGETGRSYELSLDRGVLTAFLSWLEARPSPRARRTEN